jgi:glucosamine-6-phosphate deaminase
MNIHIFENTSILYNEASKKIVELVQKKPNAILGLATGQSPLGIYNHLILEQQKNSVDYRFIKTFNLDEYVGLNPNHPQSYRFFMNENLFLPLAIHSHQTEIPSGAALDLDLECRRYDALLDQFEIDLQVLGIGTNGHIGFNEPGVSFELKTHVVTLDYQTRIDNSRFFNDIDEVPKKAITMGIHHIMKAKMIILIAIGSSKSDAIFKMVKGPITTSLPASILQNHPNVHLYLDKNASVYLTK